MNFVFFRFRRREKMDLLMKGLMGQSPQNFWARTAPFIWTQTIVTGLTRTVAYSQFGDYEAAAVLDF